MNHEDAKRVRKAQAIEEIVFAVQEKFAPLPPDRDAWGYQTTLSLRKVFGEVARETLRLSAEQDNSSVGLAW